MDGLVPEEGILSAVPQCEATLHFGLKIPVPLPTRSWASKQGSLTTRNIFEGLSSYIILMCTSRTLWSTLSPEQRDWNDTISLSPPTSSSVTPASERCMSCTTLDGLSRTNTMDHQLRTQHPRGQGQVPTLRPRKILEMPVGLDTIQLCARNLSTCPMVDSQFFFYSLLWVVP